MSGTLDGLGLGTQTPDLVLLRNFAIALCLGALVGVDRERKAASEPYFGGLRTYVLVALTGAVAMWLGAAVGFPSLVGYGLLGLTALLAVAYTRTHRPDGAIGLTGEVAALAVYLLGAACTAGHPEVAVTLGITTAGLLAFREPLHALAGKVGPEDLTAGLKLLFATFVVLPLLPDRTIDPLDAVNPYRLWWLVTLISGLSLGGYVAVRWLGERAGMALTGLLGGLSSSTAVTMSAARRSHEPATSPDTLAMTVLLAWAVMFARILVEVAVVNRALLPALALPVGAMAVTAALAAGWLGTRPHAGPAASELRVTNPFSLWEAIKFAAVFTVVLLGVAAGRRYLGPGALYVVAALAGTTDVDAITLSVAGAGSDVGEAAATGAIVIAAASNTLVKTGFVVFAGTRPLAARVGGAAVAVVAVGAAVALLT